MGDFTKFIATGGFSAYLYHDVGDILTASNGVQAKVINSENDLQDIYFHDSLPIFSNTSEIYLKRSDEETHPIEQARVYDARMPKLDIDWGHTHGEYKTGTVHVHEWRQDSKGNWRRSKPRGLNNEEIARYGELLKIAYPDVKLR